MHLALPAVGTVRRRLAVAATVVNLTYRTAYNVFVVVEHAQNVATISSVSTDVPLSCACRLYLMLPLETNT